MSYLKRPRDPAVFRLWIGETIGRFSDENIGSYAMSDCSDWEL